ncbi:MAG: hypothetical protein M3P30_02825 [Chloroflexota bacterium]|nr:hypothetical protein [Chloroflexota bacterium]
MDRFSEAERTTIHPKRDAHLAWLATTTTWFAVAAVGIAIVFIGLAVDAYRHNHSAAEESLLSLGNPGHLLAAIGLGLTSIGVLVGLSISALRGITTTEHAVRRFVPLTAAWVALAAIAIGSITYVGASGVTIGHSHGTTDTTSVTADGHVHSTPADDAGGVAAGLKSQGIATDGGATDPSTVPGALVQGVDGTGSHVHDHGRQPTFTQVESMSADQLLPLFPADTVSAVEFPTLKQQIEQVRAVALKFPTTDAANKAGYVRTTSDVPFMGEHYLNYDYVRDGIFDPSKPEGLLFSKVDNGPEKLVGVWFLQIPGIGGVKKDVSPVGFAGNLDLWHAHTGLCLVGLSGASEGETKDSCTAKSGNFVPDLRWMMHVWVSPVQDNPDGVFAYLNNDLFAKQQAVAKGTSAPTGNTP